MAWGVLASREATHDSRKRLTAVQAGAIADLSVDATGVGAAFTRQIFANFPLQGDQPKHRRPRPAGQPEPSLPSRCTVNVGFCPPGSVSGQNAS